MHTWEKNNHKTIVAAIAFDQYSANVIKSAASFCKRTGFDLRLLHVCQPTLARAALSPYFEPGLLTEVDFAIEKQQIAEAEAKLTQLAKGIDAKIKVTTKVLAGPADEWINADALMAKAAMIFVGAGHAKGRFVPKDWSTALSLMARANIPVMTVDHEHPLNVDSGLVKIVFADDLTEASLGGLDTAINLMHALKKCAFYHLHVDGIDRANLSAALNTAIAASHSAPASKVSASEVFEMVQSSLHHKLEERTKPYLSLLSDREGIQYVPRVLNGDVGDQLVRSLDEIAPNVVIFGRHHAVHRHPFFLGRVPFHIMVAQQRPVIVAPKV